VFNEKLTTGQNKTDNTNKTHDVVTNTQSSLEDQESTYSYDQLEGQPEDRFLHNLASTQFVPEKQTIVQNTAQADIKPEDVHTSTSNVFGNQHSLYPNNQHEEQITQEYNEVRFLKLSNDSQVLTDTSASRIYITGHINKTKDVVNSFQISLNNRQTKYSDEERKGQPENGFSETQKLHHPDGTQLLSDKMTTVPDKTQDDTQHKNVVSNFKMCQEINVQCILTTNE